MWNLYAAETIVMSHFVLLFLALALKLDLSKILEIFPSREFLKIVLWPVITNIFFLDAKVLIRYLKKCLLHWEFVTSIYIINTFQITYKWINLFKIVFYLKFFLSRIPIIQINWLLLLTQFLFNVVKLLWSFFSFLALVQ